MYREEGHIVKSRRLPYGWTAAFLNYKQILFEFAASLFVTILCGCRTEEVIDIRLHDVNHTSLLFESGSFIIEPLLVLKKTLLIGLESRQSTSSLHTLRSSLFQAVPYSRLFKTTNCVSSKSTFNYIRENMVNPYFRETQQEPFVNRTNTPLPPCDRGKK